MQSAVVVSCLTLASSEHHEGINSHATDLGLCRNLLLLFIVAGNAIFRRRVKGKGPVLDTALLHDEHMLSSALQSLKWQLIGMS